MCVLLKQSEDGLVVVCLWWECLQRDRDGEGAFSVRRRRGRRRGGRNEGEEAVLVEDEGKRVAIKEKRRRRGGDRKARTAGKRRRRSADKIVVVQTSVFVHLCTVVGKEQVDDGEKAVFTGREERSALTEIDVE